MPEAPEITLAEASAAAARQRLTSTLAALQARLQPRALASDAAQGIVAKSQNLAQAGVAAVRRKPLTIAGAVAAAGLLLARRSIARWIKARRNATVAKPSRSSP